nr:hypothetical protein [Armatimonadota bacterium]
DLFYVVTQLSVDSNDPGNPLPQLKLIFLAVSTALPILLVGGALLCGAVTGNPVLGYLGGALRKVAPLVASVLLLAYAGMIISTARMEASVGSDLQRSMTHEGRFLAEKTGQVWPGR